MAWLYTTEQSLAFFIALREASLRILKYYGLPLSSGHKRYKKWTRGRPIGVTTHYTAGVTWKGSVRWLNYGVANNSVSCQMLILDRMLPEVASVYADYPELDDLNVVVILMSDGVIPCWHAGWVNRLTFGIENRNAGILRGTKGDWRWWAKNWKAKFPHERLGKTPINIEGQWWEPYTFGQVHANIVVGQHLHCLNQMHGGLDPRWYLGHHNTEGKKSDVAKAYPLKDARDAVFAQMPLEGVPWLQLFADAPDDYAQDIEDEDDALFLMELEDRSLDRADGEVDWDELSEMPAPEMQALIQDGDWKQELDSVRRALEKLGYVTGGSGLILDEDTALAIYQFQKSQKGLKADKIPGNLTQEALYQRLQTFRLVA